MNVPLPKVPSRDTFARAVAWLSILATIGWGTLCITHHFS